MDDRRADSEQRVTPLELFFDLVFVYAITQVTQLMSEDPAWQGVGHGLLVFAALWWAWTGYAWLTNTLEPEEGQVRDVPTLLVAGKGSPPAFRRVTERMAAAIPDSRTILVGGGHFIDPGEADVLKFVGEVLGR